MTRQNRIGPFGRLIVTPARGTRMGNRGCIHDASGVITKRWSRKAWVICLLEYKGRHRQIMAPGRYTELFFLDEATALAAGHRPCGNSATRLRRCRREQRIVVLQCYINTNKPIMALSVRLEPAIEARIQQEARRLGISKSEFVKDALERVLGLKNPAELLRQVRSDTSVGATDTSELVSQKVRKKLREKHSS